MKGRNLLVAVPALLLAMGCENPQQPNGLAAPTDPSGVISDGTRLGGNPDFFFLPPLVPNPSGSSNFERGKFNNAVQASLTVEICELVPEPGGALPTGTTACANEVATPHTAPVKTFAPGTVRQVGLPSAQNGWWTTQNLPNEGFYYVLWDTRQSNLDITKYYRIKVLIAGSNVPLGYADVDPMSNMREWHNVRTGDVIAMVDDAMLPIPFRVEKGALCDGGNCNSATITNSSPGGSQSVVVDAGGGSIAGATFPDGWLPEDGPQSVVVTVAEVNIGLTTGEGGPTVCHPGLPFQQFRGCFNYTTTPALEPINEAGDQFAQPVTVAVCFELEGTGDPREKFAELYASGPNEPPHALADVPDGGLLGVTTKDCSADPVVAQSSNPLVQLASTGWRKMRGGLGRFFGVKTAYAVDLGLGGIVKGFSNISPVVPANLEVEGPTDLGTQPAGTQYILNVMIMGSNHHADHVAQGIGGVPVTFSVASTSEGTVEPHLTAVGTVTPTSVESITRNDSETGGEASAIWHLPSAPGTYTLTVTAAATGSPVTFTATVGAGDRRMLSMQTGATFQLSVAPPDIVATWLSSAPAKVQVSATGLATAITGGESSNGGDDATVTTVLSTGSPGPIWLVNTPFDIFPRITTAAWAPVTGAASYDIAIEFGNGCTGYANCSTWASNGGATGIAGLSFTFNFVGTQPGRWHVTTRDASGNIIPGSLDESGAPIPGSPSPWIHFRYIDGL